MTTKRLIDFGVDEAPPGVVVIHDYYPGGLPQHERTGLAHNAASTSRRRRDVAARKQAQALLRLDDQARSANDPFHYVLRKEQAGGAEPEFQVAEATLPRDLARRLEDVYDNLTTRELTAAIKDKESAVVALEKQPLTYADFRKLAAYRAMLDALRQRKASGLAPKKSPGYEGYFSVARNEAEQSLERGGLFNQWSNENVRVDPEEVAHYRSLHETTSPGMLSPGSEQMETSRQIGELMQRHRERMGGYMSRWTRDYSERWLNIQQAARDAADGGGQTDAAADTDLEPGMAEKYRDGWHLSERTNDQLKDLLSQHRRSLESDTEKLGRLKNKQKWAWGVRHNKAVIAAIELELTSRGLQLPSPDPPPPPADISAEPDMAKHFRKEMQLHDFTDQELISELEKTRQMLAKHSEPDDLLKRTFNPNQLRGFLSRDKGIIAAIELELASRVSAATRPPVLQLPPPEPAPPRKRRARSGKTPASKGGGSLPTITMQRGK